MAISDDIKLECFKLHYFHQWSYRKISGFFEGHPNRKATRKFCKEIEAKLLRTMTHKQIQNLLVLPKIFAKAY